MNNHHPHPFHNHSPVLPSLHIGFAPASPVSQAHRRRFSAANPARKHPEPGVHSTGNTTAFPAERGRVDHLAPLADTPPGDMSRSGSPSSSADGDWATPGPSTRHATPDGLSRTSYGGKASTRPTTWVTAQSRSAAVHAYSASPSRGNAFFSRKFRTMSASLPHFSPTNAKDFSDKEKLGRGRMRIRLGGLVRRVLRLAWRLRLLILLGLAYVMLMLVWYKTPLHVMYRRNAHLGGGNKFTIILGANIGGGVMEWKGAREWAIERDSVRNKKKYANRHGYNLRVVDLSTKKKYAHEWRESWEKVDTIRRMMREHPESEWFWWLDLKNFIMEPSYSLQRHIFNDLQTTTYRDINAFNPLNISHPFTHPYLDPLSLSLTGDDDPASINLVVPQDCAGFNLGSFFIRRSEWTDRLLDIWWDPVLYEQRHMQWEHKEQDALEHLYTNHPWVRPHVAFLPQRKAGSYPPGACGKDQPLHHYQEKDRDFMLSMAGCEWGRDCWGEMYTYRELSNRLNRTWWEKFKDGLSDMFKAVGNAVPGKRGAGKSAGDA